jgi:hypothetical protein
MTSIRTAIARALLAAAATAALVAPASAASFEKTIPIPRTGRANLGWSAGACSVRSVSLRNYPSPEDIRKARREDPKDTSWLWWDFHVENRGSGKCRISIVVDVYDRAGHVVKSSDRSDTVEEHKMDDNVRVSTRMRTIDIADSPHARLKGEIGPKN